MNANALKMDLTALAQPKSREDLIALAKEIRAEFACIHEHMDRILQNREQLTDA